MCPATFSLALKSPEYSHILLIVPISVPFIVWRRSALPCQGRFDIAVGFPILVLAITVGLWTNRVPSPVAPTSVLFTSMLALAGCGKKNQGSNFERFGERELNDLQANFRST